MISDRRIRIAIAAAASLALGAPTVVHAGGNVTAALPVAISVSVLGQTIADPHDPNRDVRAERQRGSSRVILKACLGR
ncbi:MAG: hypothetical protein ACHQ6T_16740, partial [Myxococcota bacterium]